MGLEIYTPQGDESANILSDYYSLLNITSTEINMELISRIFIQKGIITQEEMDIIQDDIVNNSEIGKSYRDITSDEYIEKLNARLKAADEREIATKAINKFLGLGGDNINA